MLECQFFYTIINNYISKQNIMSNFTNTKIGYDFDGVIHLDVKPVNVYGERWSFNNIAQPATKIIDQINKTGLHANIYIISARPSNQSNYNIISDFLSKYILPNVLNQIKIYLTSGKSKIDLISKLELDQFYDDSCLRIGQIHNAQLKSVLPKLKKLYLFVPETQVIVQVTKDNINTLCSMPDFLKKLIHESHSIIDTTTNIIELIDKYGYVVSDPAMFSTNYLLKEAIDANDPELILKHMNQLNKFIIDSIIHDSIYFNI